MLAACSQLRKDLAAAATHVQSALALTPGDPIVHYALAEILDARGDKTGAIASLGRAIEINPGVARVHNLLGIMLGESGDADGAIAAFEQAVRIDPKHARAWNNLGNAQRTLRRMAEAEESFRRAVALQPDYQLAAANLAVAQRDRGEVIAAETTLRATLARSAGRPPQRQVLVLLAGLLRERGELDEAAALYRRAIDAEPDESAGEWFSLGWVLAERGEPEAAREAYARAQSAGAGDPRGAIGRRLVLPMIYPDAAAIDAARAQFASGVAELTADCAAFVRGRSVAQVLDGLRWTNFLLAYQGRDDRALQEGYAAFAGQAIVTAAPRWREPIARCPRRDRLRVGFASAFFHVGTCGRYFRSWLTELDRDNFEVYVYHLWPGSDEIADAIERRATRFRSYGGGQARPSIVAPAIKDDELDVLIYPELGMDVTTFALSALRLAPLQYAAWGHPVTTGQSTIDGYFSCAKMEPPDGAAHYTEPLLELPGIGTRYLRPAMPADATRERFGLPTDATLLLCPQSLFKIHPDNDELFADVLLRNPRAILVFFAGRHAAITDQFMRRFSGTLKRRGLAAGERTRVLPQVSHDDYLRVNLVCDAMLDTLHWSGGNTSLDALACALPVVTLAGEFMRGRQSAAMLSLLGVPELVARDRGDYVAIASRLVTEADWRMALRTRIAAGQDSLFDVREPVVRLQAIIQAETERSS